MNDGYAVTNANGKSYAYDACGNMTNRNGQTLMYDEENRLRQVSGNDVPTVTIGYADGGLPDSRFQIPEEEKASC